MYSTGRDFNWQLNRAILTQTQLDLCLVFENVDTLQLSAQPNQLHKKGVYAVVTRGLCKLLHSMKRIFRLRLFFVSETKIRSGLAQFVDVSSNRAFQ